MAQLNRTLLLELAEHESYRELLKLLETLVELQETELLKTPADQERNLVLAKARVEGAGKLVLAFTREIERTKKPAKE